MTFDIFRLVAITLLPTLITGCYLRIITSEGGYIESASTYRDCPTSQTCEVIVDTTNFQETFTAIANPGYEFKGWAKGPSFVCGNVLDSICNIALLHNSVLAPVVHSERTGYLMPVFEKLDVSSPIIPPQVRDANGEYVGDINYEEEYGVYADVHMGPFASTIIRFSFRYQSWGAQTGADIYFENDNCQLDSASRVYANEPIVEVGFGRGFVREYQHTTHIFNRLSPGPEVLVGSKWSGDECVDIADEVLAFPMYISWSGVDDFVRPLTRHGPPPCSYGQVEGCY